MFPYLCSGITHLKTLIIQKDKLLMLGIEEKDPVITGKYADDLYEEYKSVYGEPVRHESGKQV